jgi:DNA primase
VGLISEDKIAEIRERTDLVQVVGEYVTLRKVGVNHVGLCPFHQERTPSFNVNGQRGFFHCFGCGKTGDVFTFLGELEGRTFVETARELARKSGVELPEAPRSPREAERQKAAETERQRLIRLHELAAEFYRAQLADPALKDAARARRYLDSRGISEATQERFRVGWAPAGWEAITRLFEEKRVPHELAERSGLVRRRENARLAEGAPPSKSTHYDLFVERVVYALTSPLGEVIGFGGRVLESVEGQPKYKNSPETPLYKKGENLFGLSLAKHAIRKGGRALVVEGNFDVMTLHEKGVDYAVAPQGTAMTEAQVALLGRFAREVVLMLDADPAGRAATLRLVRLFVAADLKARIAQLRASGGQKVDPDELARRDLPRLIELVDGAVDAVEFFFDQVAGTAEPSVPGRVAAVEECVPLLRSVRDPLARDLYTERLAQLLKIDVGLVRRALRGPLSAPAAPRAAAEPAPSAPRPPARRPLAPECAKLFALLAQHPHLVSRLDPAAIVAITDEDARRLLEQAREANHFDAQALLAAADPAIRDGVARALLSDEFAPHDDLDAPRALSDIQRRIGAPDDPAVLERERKAALARGDFARVRELTAQILKSRARRGEHHQGETSR